MDDDFYGDEIDEEDLPMYQQMLQQAQDPSLQGAQQIINEGFEIMEEELDEDYEPTNDEIVEYAKYLGMDLREDQDLFYIAKEGLKAPLPGPWKPCKSPGGNIYYFNFENQELQKEHPCDDYYRKYYLNEKSSMRRKKEEKVIKKQIKQQQQVMNASGNDKVNNSLQQMMLMNMSGLDASTSMVNERVQVELEQLMEQQEEQKIIHERKKRDELKKYDIEKQEQFQQIKSQAMEQVKANKERIKKDFDRNKMEQEKKKKNDFIIEKDKRVREIREQERRKVDKRQKVLQQKYEEQKEEVKRDEESKNKMLEKSVKNQYRQKLQLEKDKVIEENNRLLEESGDIDAQVRLFRSEMMSDKFENAKYDVDEEYRQKQKDLKQEFQNKIEKEKVKLLERFKENLEKETEKEKRKSKMNYSKLDTRKEELKKEHQQKLKEEKRKIERQYLEKLRNLKNQNEEELEQSKEDQKSQHQLQFQGKEKRLEREYENQRENRLNDQNNYEQDEKAKFEKLKSQIEKEFYEDFQREKRNFEEQENEKSETYQSIIREIQQNKNKVRELESKVKQQDKDKKNLEKAIDDLGVEKRGKERQITNMQFKQPDQTDYELDLEKEFKEKQDEYDRLQDMIRERKLQQPLYSQKIDFYSKQEPSEDYNKLSQELDGIKLMLMDLKNRDSSFIHGSQALSAYNVNKRKNLIPLNSSAEEIKTLVEIELPKAKAKREKYDNERILIRQLVNNLERNRVKIRKQYFDSNDFSAQRKLALSSIKDKLDDQARILTQEETDLKEKCDFFRRKEEKLRKMKQKIEILEKSRGDEKEDTLLKDVQVDYDKYLKLYGNDIDMNFRGNRKGFSEKKQQNLSAFKDKWAEYLVEEKEADLKPLSGFEEEMEIFKPKSLFAKYEMGQANYKNKLGTNNYYEKEYEKVKENRNQIRSFLNDQQKWLSKMKNDLNMSLGSGQKPSGGMTYIGSSESLLNLKNNLSKLLSNY